MGKAEKTMGKRGEHAAQAFYESRGAEVIATNWECPFGEVDIIVKEDDTLVLVEVKTRKSSRSGYPEEHITRKKQKRYLRCAKAFCKDTEVAHRYIRFDVVAILVSPDNKGILRWIPDAFGED